MQKMCKVYQKEGGRAQTQSLHTEKASNQTCLDEIHWNLERRELLSKCDQSPQTPSQAIKPRATLEEEADLFTSPGES